MLSRIKSCLASQWRDIGYELIKSSEIDNIEKNHNSEESRCFAMLKKWQSTNSKTCYCMIFDALEIYEHISKITEVKNLITK